MSVAKAVLVLEGINSAIMDRMENAFVELDDALERDDEVARDHLDAHIQRLSIIMRPVPPFDSYKGMAFRVVQPRLWSGTITNPGGQWGGQNASVKTRKSTYTEEDSVQEVFVS